MCGAGFQIADMDIWNFGEAGSHAESAVPPPMVMKS
jgi:hypothetical protein